MSLLRSTICVPSSLRWPMGSERCETTAELMGISARRGRAGHAGDRLVEVADGPVGITGRVLDADTRQPVLDRGLHCCGDVLGGLPVAVLEVAVDRQAGQAGEQLRVREVLVSGDLV